jgi:hypothetical protein
VDLFATDTSRWVKAALHQSLGEVLYNSYNSHRDFPYNSHGHFLYNSHGDFVFYLRRPPHVVLQIIYNCGPKVSPSVISYFLSLASTSGFAGALHPVFAKSLPCFGIVVLHAFDSCASLTQATQPATASCSALSGEPARS